MSEHDQLPDELASLFAAERAAPVADIVARSAARARLAASVAHVPLGKAAATGALGGAGKTIAILAITVGAGAAMVDIVTSGTPTRVAEAPTRAVAPDRDVVPPPAPPAPPAPAPMLVETDDTPARPTSPVRSPRNVRSPSEAARPPAVSPSQHQLLRRAWVELSAGRADEAFELAREDERLHPDGVLAEEREALVVQALVELGRDGDARVAAERFIARYPTSVHRARIDRALEEAP